MPREKLSRVPVAAMQAKARTGALSGSTPGSRLVEERIGFVGLGRMGSAMAKNLAQSGREVIGFVRRPERSKELSELGVESTTDMRDLFKCTIVISMLPNDSAVHEVVFGHDTRSGTHGLSSGLNPGALHLSMSTISTEASSAFAAEHARVCQGYVAAPVFGNPDAAKAKELFIIAAGAAGDIERCRPLFDILGQRTFEVGADPAAANLVKLAGNVMTAATLEILGEVLALTRKRGIDPEHFLNILTETMFGSRVHKIYGKKIAAQLYTTGGFVFPLALKDVRLALAEAEAANVPMPSVSVVRDRLIAGMARGYAQLDWSALGLLAAEEAGLANGASTTRDIAGSGPTVPHGSSTDSRTQAAAPAVRNHLKQGVA